ncbi:unnamed protein product [Musa acuminata subsp. burmannicoides]
MGHLSSLGIGLSLVSGCLFLALVAEVYYMFWWKKRARRDIEDNYGSPAKELLHLFCWNQPSSLSSTALNPQEISASVDVATCSDGKDLPLKPFEGEDTIEAELMRLHRLAGPPRFLFTIKEETMEDLESEDGWCGEGRNRRGSRGKSLSDLFLSSDTPFLTPLSSPSLFTPPLTPLDCYRQSGFNPLFESSKEEDFVRMWSSPPPTFKFLKDAEEKLHRKKLTEEARQAHRSASHPSTSHSRGPEEKDATFITIVIEKNRDRGQQHHSSASQVIPLPSSPSSVGPLQKKWKKTVALVLVQSEGGNGSDGASNACKFLETTALDLWQQHSCDDYEEDAMPTQDLQAHLSSLYSRVKDFNARCDSSARQITHE